jgi:hypothetical protein
MKESELIFSCEVKKLFLRSGVKRHEWVTSTVSDAIRDLVTEFRCKDCHGALKIHKKIAENGPAPYVEHKSRQDSEYCPSGMYFRQNPGREPRLSVTPVD